MATDNDEFEEHTTSQTVIVKDGRAEMKLRRAEAIAAAAKYKAIVEAMLHKLHKQRGAKKSNWS